MLVFSTAVVFLAGLVCRTKRVSGARACVLTTAAVSGQMEVSTTQRWQHMSERWRKCPHKALLLTAMAQFAWHPTWSCASGRVKAADTHAYTHTNSHSTQRSNHSTRMRDTRCELNRSPLQRLVTKVQSLQSGWCLLQHMHHTWQQSEGNIPVLFLSMLHLSAITQKLNANPFKMNLKFNDKSQANVNRSVQLGLFEILTSPG